VRSASLGDKGGFTCTPPGVGVLRQSFANYPNSVAYAVP